MTPPDDVRRPGQTPAAPRLCVRYEGHVRPPLAFFGQPVIDDKENLPPGAVFEVPPSGVVVGRVRDADIPIFSPHVERRHARLWRTDQGIGVENLTTVTGTYVNGKLVQQALLVQGDHLWLAGHYAFVVVAADEGGRSATGVAAPPPALVSRLRLRYEGQSLLPGSCHEAVERENLETLPPGAVFEVTPSGLVAGRSAESDIKIFSAYVARRHAWIRLTKDGIEVTDLASTNGTFVNGDLVRQAILHQGDRLSLGGLYEFVVVAEEAT